MLKDENKKNKKKATEKNMSQLANLVIMGTGSG